MARKTLLNEHEIRKFLKLANITTVGDDKIQEMGGKYYNRDAKETPQSEDDPDDDAGVTNEENEFELSEEEDEVDMEMDAEEDGEELDMDADVEMGDEPMDDEGDLDMGGIDGDEREELMADVVRAVAQALGIEDQVSVEAGEDDGMEGGDMDAMPEPALDDEPALDAPADEPAMAMGDDAPADDEPMMEEEEELEESNEDELVAEVARRVAQRLQQDNQKDKMVDALAERIMKRLTK